ncbi:hypothetical protein GGC65_003968 [Sphingopyxis sp. OAS728]|nr:hypothetical protein [Sphingopyxis sp. OAS728]MBE1529512.1 hypothetical protein [Sphingopyxis sp. OAS728]
MANLAGTPVAEKLAFPKSADLFAFFFAEHERALVRPLSAAALTLAK